MRTDTHRQSGFTIVELIVTILLIGVLLPTIVTFLNAITNMNGRASTISTVNAYVENRIESFRSAGYKSVPITTGDVNFTGTEALPANLPQPHSATYNVALLDPANPTLKKITITVNFRSFDSTETRTYITYLGELGVGQY
jgi:prepilin-type N-terminal cleavage/methylation domain-containing protein